MEHYFISAFAVLIFMIIIYTIAQIIKDNSIVDIFWGIGFIVISSVLMIYFNHLELMHILLYLAILVWGLRLSIHIWQRNKGKPEDFRYAEWRKNWGSKAWLYAFFKVFMLQGLVMFIIALPVITALSRPEVNISLFNYVGLFLFVLGFLFEAIGDYQLKTFKKKNKGKIMDKGLWKITRHPNYFGEAVLWWGIFIFCFQQTSDLIFIVSPIIMTILLRFGSGVPMLEKKYQNKPEFISYAAKTPVFFPIIGKKGI